jgi:hypothetical protein
MAKRTTDLLVHGHGSIYLLRPTSRRGRRWVDVRVTSDRTEWAGAIAGEPAGPGQKAAIEEYIAEIQRRKQADRESAAMQAQLDALFGIDSAKK